MFEEYVFWVLVIISSVLLAKVEIQMEGKHGYAERLPVTWRATNKWVQLFFTGTSYHLYMGLFLVTMMHIPFAVGLAWSARAEMLVLSFLAFVTVLEDFLWFVLNPAYGIKKFKRREIVWFRDRWFLVPIWYWWYLGAGVGLHVGSYYL